jgi:AraC-like DNA-binding protein
MATEQVRMWRPGPEDRILLMAGRTTHYAVEPRGEYVFGIVAGQPMRSRRGREQRLVRPGQFVAWDPSSGHSGSSATGQPWSSRLIIVEGADLAALAGDQDTDILANVAFPTPVLSDPALAGEFRRLHIALETPTTRLERDERLTLWLRTLIGRFSTVRSPRTPLGPRDTRAFRLACDYLGDRPERNVGLDELAAVAGTGKFRLIRVFRERTGLPPHALHLAHRIRAARRLLEAGKTAAETASATGFADQSHLHRHFHRGLGLTPGEYQKRFTAQNPLNQ